MVLGVRRRESTLNKTLTPFSPPFNGFGKHIEASGSPLCPRYRSQIIPEVPHGAPDKPGPVPCPRCTRLFRDLYSNCDSIFVLEDVVPGPTEVRGKRVGIPCISTPWGDPAGLKSIHREGLPLRNRKRRDDKWIMHKIIAGRAVSEGETWL